MRVALLQTAGAGGDLDAALAGLDRALAAAAAQGADLLVTPEMWAGGYAVGPERIAGLAEPADGPLAGRVAGLASRHGVAVAWGFAEVAGPDNHQPQAHRRHRPHNAVQLVDRHGTARATYRKTHLYGDLDRAQFTPGDVLGATGVLDLADGSSVRVGLLVCYDVEFPEPVRLAALAGAQLLVVPTALMAPWTDVATRVVPVRALENALPVAYVNRAGSEGDLTYAGLSCLVDAGGLDVVRAGDGEELLVGHVTPRPDDLTRSGDPGALEAPYLTDRRPELYAALATTPTRAPGGAP